MTHASVIKHLRPMTEIGFARIFIGESPRWMKHYQGDSYLDPYYVEREIDKYGVDMYALCADLEVFLLAHVEAMKQKYPKLLNILWSESVYVDPDDQYDFPYSQFLYMEYARKFAEAGESALLKRKPEEGARDPFVVMTAEDYSYELAADVEYDRLPKPPKTIRNMEFGVPEWLPIGETQIDHWVRRKDYNWEVVQFVFDWDNLSIFWFEEENGLPVLKDERVPIRDVSAPFEFVTDLETWKDLYKVMETGRWTFFGGERSIGVQGEGMFANIRNLEVEKTPYQLWQDIQQCDEYAPLLTTEIENMTWLKKAIPSSKFDRERRPVLSWIRTLELGGRTAACSADGYRLHVEYRDVEPDIWVMVPGKSIEIDARSQYPDVQSIVHTPVDQFSVHTKPLVKTLKTMRNMNSVKFVCDSERMWNKNLITVKAYDSAKGEIAVDVDVINLVWGRLPNGTFKVDVKYALDALSGMGKISTFSFDRTPYAIYDDNRIAYLMPVSGD